MVRSGPMASPKSLLNRREMIAGLGAVALTPISPSAAFAQVRPELQLEGKVESLPLRSGAPATPVWGLGEPDLRFKRGDVVKVGWNGLESGGHLAMLNWRGIDGAPEVEPLPARLFKVTKLMPLRHAGTFLCDLGLLGGYGLPLLATGDAVALVAAASILRRGRPSPALERARK